MIAHDRSWLEVPIGLHRRTLQRTGSRLVAEGSATETVGQTDNECVSFFSKLVFIKI
jgi:hypothetical protein